MGLVLFVQSLALELRVLCGSFRVQGFELGLWLEGGSHRILLSHECRIGLYPPNLPKECT